MLQAVGFAYLPFCTIAVYCMMQAFFCHRDKDFDRWRGFAFMWRVCLVDCSDRIAVSGAIMTSLKESVDLFERSDAFCFLESKHESVDRFEVLSVKSSYSFWVFRNSSMAFAMD